MPVEEMLSASVDLMLLGMGTVFIILGLLIAAIMLMAKWITAEPAALAATVAGAGQTSADRAAGVVAAIQAAVHTYRGAIDRKK